MKFACAKCNHVLTKDLYLTTKIDRENTVEDGEIIFSIAEVKPGTFLRFRYKLWEPKWSDRQTAINRDDALGCFMYPFKEGNGCCANHYIEVECSNCYTQVGWEFYDCYETLKHIELLDNKVVRDFSRRPTIASPKASHVSFAEDVVMSERDVDRSVDLAMKAFNQGNSTEFKDPIEDMPYPDEDIIG